MYAHGSLLFGPHKLSPVLERFDLRSNLFILANFAPRYKFSEVGISHELGYTHPGPTASKQIICLFVIHWHTPCSHQLSRVIPESKAALPKPPKVLKPNTIHRNLRFFSSDSGKLLK